VGRKDVLFMFERHYSIRQLAAAWNLSRDTVRREFLKELDIIIIYRPRRGVRIYRVIRVPETVAKRVYARLINGGSRRRRQP